MANITGDMTFDMTGSMTGDMIPSTATEALFPTQWSDFATNFTELPPSYVLVDQEQDAYPNDYLAQTNANVLTADDGNEVSATIGQFNSNTYWILAGWGELPNSLPDTNAQKYFVQSHVSNVSDMSNISQAYGLIGVGNNEPVTNNGVVTILVRMKYSGTAPFNVNVNHGFLRWNDVRNTIINPTTSFADYTIPSRPFYTSSPSASLNRDGGFFVRFNVQLFGFSTLHIDKIALVGSL